MLHYGGIRFSGMRQRGYGQKEKENPSSIGSVQQSGSTEPEMDYQPVPIPNQLKEFIMAKYPQALILEYDREKNSQEIDILDGKTHKEVVFSLSNEWIYTDWGIQYKNLPEAVKNAAKQACSEKGYTVYDDDSVVYDTPNGLRYQVEVESGNQDYKLWFDKSGKKVQAIK